MPESTRPLPIRLSIALLLTAAVLVVGSISGYRKVQSFQPLGFDARPDGAHWQVSTVDDAGTGLEVGDQIVLVNGESLPRVGALETALRQSDTAELVLLRQERLETVSYLRPALELDIPYLILALIGCGYLLIGFYTLLRHRERPSLLFHFWCVTSTAVYLISAEPPFLDSFSKGAYLVETVARVLLAPLTLHLFSVFPRLLGKSARIRRLIPFYYLPAALLLLMQLDLVAFRGQFLLGGAMTSAVPLLDRLELYHLVLFSLAAAGVLAWRVWRTADHEPRRQSSWVAIGMALGYLPFLFLYVLPRELGANWPDLITVLAVLPLALVPVTFAYAILRYKLWDIGAIVRDSLALSLTVVVGVIGFSLANLTINRWVPSDFELPRNLLVFTSGLMIAGLMVPARRGLGRSLERIQYRGSYGKRRALSDFGREILHPLHSGDTTTVSAELRHRLATDLEISQVNLLTLKGEALVPASVEPSLEHFLRADEFDSDFWDREVASLAGLDFPTDELTTEHKLHAAGYRYAFPLKVRAHRMGLVVTGYKEDDLPLSSDDVDLLRGVFNQVALALENTELLGQVKRQLDEVSRLQQFNQQIIESSPAGIAALDPDGNVLSANKALADLLGRSTDELEGEPLRRYVPIDPLPRPGEGLREVSFTDRAGNERYLQLSVALLENAAHDTDRVVVMQDVTERVSMENTLKEKERLASLGMLAAGVAHEVNTPITGISSYAQMLLAETPEQDPRHDLLRKVEKQTFRAARIVNHLLDFARDDSGDRQDLDLADVVDESLDLLVERIAEDDVQLDWQRPAEEVWIHGNNGELQQVLTNLVVNGLDAMNQTTLATGRATDPSGKKLRVRVEAGEKWVWLSVEDSGPGIPVGELDKIFQPFYSTKLSKGGTGLGLSISYSIIKKHEGDIRVVSHPGEGCRFIVELPRKADGAKT